MIGASRYFAPRYFAARFWPKVGGLLRPLDVCVLTVRSLMATRTVRALTPRRTVRAHCETP